MNDSVPTELLSKHPTFQCEGYNNRKLYKGTLIINAEKYRIKIEEKVENEGKIFQLKYIEENLKKFENEFKHLNDLKNIDITNFVDKVEEIIRNQSNAPKNYSYLYRKILYEYSEFTKFFIHLKSSELSRDLSFIKAVVYDESRRQHEIKYGINYDELKDIFYFKEYDLPKNQQKTLDKTSSSLLDLHNIFLGYIEALQSYFDLMDVIDTNSNVIYPKNDLRKNNYRRISLGENICVIITIDPFNVTACPHFAFLGPERLINEYRDKLIQNLDKWNNKGDIFQEILNILALEHFPLPENSTNTQNSTEILLREDSDCSICFSSDLNGKLPEIVCNNKCCENCYHNYCLYEWLLSINSMKILNEIKGPCPNCEKIISCPIPE